MDKTALRGLIILRSNDEKSVCADTAGFLTERDGVFGVVASRARDDGDSACDTFCGKFDGIDLFLIGEGGGFARGSANDERVNACVKLSIEDICERFVIDRASLHRGDDGGSSALEKRCFHSRFLSCA